MEELNKKHPLYQEDLHNILATDGIGTIKGKRIIVTGATGLIGTQMVDALMLLDDVDVCVTGRTEKKARERFGEYFGNPRFHFVERDATAPFDESMEADYIVPMASPTHPMAYSQWPVETMMVNLKGAEHALRLAQRCGARVLYPSTVEVYGSARGGDKFTEDYTGLLNLSTARACYTESKRASEAMCQSFAAEFGVDVVIARLPRVFGPSVLPTDTKASSQFLAKALRREDIVLKSKGEQYFSYIYVADAVSALLHILLHGRKTEAYNIANAACDVHLRDFAQTCAAHAGTRVIFDLPSENEARGYSIATTAIMDGSKLQGAGWKGRYGFEDAVERTLKILDGEVS